MILIIISRVIITNIVIGGVIFEYCQWSRVIILNIFSGVDL